MPVTANPQALGAVPLKAARDRRLARPILERSAATFRTSRHRIHIVCDPELRLDLAQLASIERIVTESILNVNKHAFPTGCTGDVWLRLSDREGRITLAVRDNGYGMGDRPGAGHNGQHMIETLAQKLGGYARFGSANFGGAEVSVVFPALQFDPNQ